MRVYARVCMILCMCVLVCAYLNEFLASRIIRMTAMFFNRVKSDLHALCMYACLVNMCVYGLFVCGCVSACVLRARLYVCVFADGES